MNWAIAFPETDWWKSSGLNGWATCIVVGFLFGIYVSRTLRRTLVHLCSAKGSAKVSSPRYGADIVNGGFVPIITEADLQNLLQLFDDDEHSGGISWIPVVDKHNDCISYCAKTREAQHESPIEYLSTSLFRNCSCKQLKDFYMDSEYRFKWDKTLESYEILHVNEKAGYEIGRFVRRFPFVRPREYVLAWRIWEGGDGSYYYFAKHCEHPNAPRSSKYTRVEHYVSGWRIRRDGDHCEVKMWHKEEMTSMAKMAFSYRIWNYMCDMERSLRKYRPAQSSGLQIPRIPVALENASMTRSNLVKDSTSGYKKKKLSMKGSGRWMANGMLVLGGAMFCARRSAPLGAKIAAVYAINKLVKPSTSTRPVQHHLPGL
ncbi:hypothetical protein KP509_01G126600 [Ceratopteris richardii]|uniref:START domain-containing protein n=1 Tax=Ceratopteris richardii TaxID=49495 RepID=A0A8T2VHA9_CERRI|nr:hypothetical protein KP509_01G126600 [Ceratopteris richardii]KAH7447902.1 hypothetical protein KP509_01G126600 [Ceratopteris richardii]